MAELQTSKKFAEYIGDIMKPSIQNKEIGAITKRSNIGRKMHLL